MTTNEDFETGDTYKLENVVENTLDEVVSVQVTDLALYEFVEYLEDLLKEIYSVEFRLLEKKTEYEMKENNLQLNTDWKEVLTGGNNKETRTAYIYDKLHVLRDEIKELELDLKYKNKRYELEDKKYTALKMIHNRETSFKGLKI